MKKGYRVRVRTFVCVCVCVHSRRLHTGSETMGASRPSQEPESSATAAPAGTHQREREKSHSALKPYFTFGFFFFCSFVSSLVVPSSSPPCRVEQAPPPFHCPAPVASPASLILHPCNSRPLLLSLIRGRIYFPRCRHRRCSVICYSPAMTDCTARLRPLSPDSAAVDR